MQVSLDTNIWIFGIFKNATRGKFYSPKATFNLPVYLEPDVNEFMNKLAEQKDVDIQLLVNEWLRKNIQLIESTM